MGVIGCIKSEPTIIEQDGNNYVAFDLATNHSKNRIKVKVSKCHPLFSQILNQFKLNDTLKLEGGIYDDTQYYITDIYATIDQMPSSKNIVMVNFANRQKGELAA